MQQELLFYVSVIRLQWDPTARRAAHFLADCSHCSQLWDYGGKQKQQFVCQLLFVWFQDFGSTFLVSKFWPVKETQNASGQWGMVISSCDLCFSTLVPFTNKFGIWKMNRNSDEEETSLLSSVPKRDVKQTHYSYQTPADNYNWVLFQSRLCFPCTKKN